MPSDSFGRVPQEHPALVDAVMRAIAPSTTTIAGRTLRDVLIDAVSLSPAPDTLFQLISYLTGGERRQKAKPGGGRGSDGDAATLDVLAALGEVRRPAPDPRPRRGAPTVAAAALLISSSLRTHPAAVSLTSTRSNTQTRPPHPPRRRLDLLGRARPRRRRGRVYVQRRTASACRTIRRCRSSWSARHRRRPVSRRFLHERMATRAPGRNWLFRHQRRDTTSSTRRVHPA